MSNQIKTLFSEKDFLFLVGNSYKTTKSYSDAEVTNPPAHRTKLNFNFNVSM